MKIQANQVEAYIKNIANQKLAGCLLFGNDQSSVNRYFLSVANKISPNLNDDFLVADLTNQRIKEEDGQIIFDEFFSLAMLGGRKLILIRDVEKSSYKAIESLAKDENLLDKSDNFLLINGGKLDKSSSLLRAIEDSKSFVAIPCYQESDYLIKKHINQSLKNKGINCDIQVVEYIFNATSKNLEIITTEVDKIDCYLEKDRHLTLESVKKIIDYDFSFSLIDFATNFVNRRSELTISRLENLLKNEYQSMEIIRFLSGYLQKLYLAKSDNIYRNQSPEVLIKKYNIFFKEADIFVNDLKSTSFEFLIDKMQKINQLEFNFKNLINSSSSREALLISSSILHILI
jgi:DNA polymerase-3 subunit delta